MCRVSMCTVGDVVQIKPVKFLSRSVEQQESAEKISPAVCVCVSLADLYHTRMCGSEGRVKADDV